MYYIRGQINMKSATSISFELDNIEIAARELTTSIKNELTFKKNTVAILYGQPDMEIGKLSALISDELGCHVIGGTTAAGVLLTNKGYHELAVVLHVLTDDDCLFATSISGSMEDDPAKEIAETYQNAYRILKEQEPAAEPKLIICITSIVQSIASDVILEKISDMCGRLPVFGFQSRWNRPPALSPGFIKSYCPINVLAKATFIGQ